MMEVRKDNMSDDTSKKDGVDDGQDQDQMVKIGDVELTADEAKELIDSGKTMKELKEQYPDIDFKELPKSFTQTRQKLAEMEKKTKTSSDDLDPDEVARRKKLDDFFNDPYVKEKLAHMTEEKQKVLKEDIEFDKTLENLESTYDGTDGRPKFERTKVIKYGMEHQIFNPLTAYKEMYEEELDEWKIKKSLEKKRPTTFSEQKGGMGSKMPDAKTPSNFKEATEAAMEIIED